ncbi:MAG TPA: GumC family protein, partial [Allocoleopsis sp.]
GQAIGLIRRRWLIIGTVAILVSGVMIFRVTKETPIYQGGFQLLVNPDAGQDKKTQINFGNGAPLQSSKTDFDTQIRVISSPQVMQPVVKAIQKKYPEVNYYSLMGNMAISKVGSSEILEISYKDSDAEKITFILKAVAKGYVNYSIAQQKGSIGQGLQFVDQQVEKLRIRVDKLQGDLQQFRQSNQLIEPEGQAQYVSGQLNTIVQQRMDTRSRFGEAQSTYKSLLGQLRMEPETALALTALNESPRYQQLLTQLKEIETKIAIESARFTENSPPIEALREQQANVSYLLQQETQQILGKNIPEGVAETLSNPNGMPNAMRAGLLQQLLTITTELRTLQVRDAALAEAQTLASKQLKRMAEVAREYTDLQRELKVATESLQRFLVVKENLEVENAQKTVPWQLISQPVASAIPISPNIPRSASAAIMIGLLAGIAAALVADKLDNVYHLPEELKEDTGLPVLGTIPFKKDLKRYGAALSDVASGQNLEAASSGKSYYYYGASAFLESFRSLHANLNFVNPD